MAALVGCGSVAEADSLTVLDVTGRGAVVNGVGNAKRREFLSNLAVGESFGAAMAGGYDVDAVSGHEDLVDEKCLAEKLTAIYYGGRQHYQRKTLFPRLDTDVLDKCRQ